MSEPEPSFETRLESMERRLAEIQQELAPEAAPRVRPDPEPAPPEPIPLRPWITGATEAPRPRPTPQTPSPAPPTEQPAPPQLELLGTLYSDLLGSVRRLLDGYEAALGRLADPSARRVPGAAPKVELTAGPFSDTAALREFERILGRLPGVREVTVRGYRPGNRAILEVQLEPKTS